MIDLEAPSDGDLPFPFPRAGVAGAPPPPVSQAHDSDSRSSPISSLLYLNSRQPRLDSGCTGLRDHRVCTTKKTDEGLLEEGEERERKKEKKRTRRFLAFLIKRTYMHAGELDNRLF